MSQMEIENSNNLLNIDEFEPFYNKFSYLKNISQKSIISLIKIKICDKDCILALDSLGIINLWIIHEDIFHFNNLGNDRLIAFSDTRILYPDLVFDLKSTVLINNSIYYNNNLNENLLYSKNINFTKMNLYGDFIILSGQFNTFFINKSKIENRVHNYLSNQNLIKMHNENFLESHLLPSHKVSLFNLDLDYKLNDFAMGDNNLINGFEIDYENNRIITFSDNGFIFIYDLINFNFVYD